MVVKIKLLHSSVFYYFSYKKARQLQVTQTFEIFNHIIFNLQHQTWWLINSRNEPILVRNYYQHTDSPPRMLSLWFITMLHTARDYLKLCTALTILKWEREKWKCCTDCLVIAMRKHGLQYYWHKCQYVILICQKYTKIIETLEPQHLETGSLFVVI